MKKVLLAIATMFPFTASVAAGVNVNLHNVGAAKVAALPAVAAMPRVQLGAATLRALPSLEAGALPGLQAAAPQQSTCVAGRCPLNKDWLVYDQTVWKFQYRDWKKQETGIFLNGIGGIIGAASNIGCTDCGGPVAAVGSIFDGSLYMLGSGIGLPAPRPHFPPGLQPIADVLFGTLETVQAIVRSVLLPSRG